MNRQQQRYNGSSNLTDFYFAAFWKKMARGRYGMERHYTDTEKEFIRHLWLVLYFSKFRVALTHEQSNH